MSALNRLQGTCPDCGKQQTITCYGSINASRNPELKAKLMNGQLFDYKCSGCDGVMSIHYPLLYHDMNIPAAVQLIPKDENAGSFDSALKQFSSVVRRDYTLRIVRTRHELAELITILDCGLNDLVIQMMKRTHIESNADLPKLSWLFSEVTVKNRDKYMKYVSPGSTYSVTVPINDGVYEVARRLRVVEPPGEWLYSNPETAMDLYAKWTQANERGHRTFEEWYLVFKQAAGRANSQLLVDPNDGSLVDFVDHEPLKRAFRDERDPEALGREFGERFDLATFGGGLQ